MATGKPDDQARVDADAAANQAAYDAAMSHPSMNATMTKITGFIPSADMTKAGTYNKNSNNQAGS